jgi:His-Xaa-Ser repeat-associated downstream radical SAM protein
MRLATVGRAVNIATPVVGTIRTTSVEDRSNAILVTSLSNHTPDDLTGYRGLITTSHADDCSLFLRNAGVPMVYAVRETEHLRGGDIVVLQSNGTIRTLCRPDSFHNALFVTERCNSNCLMCSQPPKDRDDTEHFLAINRELIQLMDPDTRVLGITGGEPTLLREDLCALLELLNHHLPTTHVQLLTNGRLFAWPDFAARFAQVRHPNLVLGIPLYSDSAVLHDYIVQAHGAFDQTVLGMHNLARWKVPVELRVVLHRLTIPRLVSLAEYTYRNLPFVLHVAFMGLEPTGYTPYNSDKLWIDPYDYQHELTQAVEHLSIRGMAVSIYNLQRCLLPRSLWSFAQKSISDWKNIYLPECDWCSERTACAGFFQSAAHVHGDHIHAI